jgi:hypothetical protein
MPIKDVSKRRLELTIKSLSQRQLKNKDILDTHKPNSINIDFGALEKRQASCLFPVNKYKKEKKASEIFISNSESFL